MNAEIADMKFELDKLNAGIEAFADKVFDELLEKTHFFKQNNIKWKAYIYLGREEYYFLMINVTGKFWLEQLPNNVTLVCGAEMVVVSRDSYCKVHVDKEV